jgi:hypothetical protein
MEYKNRNHAYLGESMEHVVGCGRVRWGTECVSSLICEPSKLRHLYNNSHNYEIQCKNPYIIEVRKNTYHVVLERPTLLLDGVMPCQFIILIDNLVVAIRVR